MAVLDSLVPGQIVVYGGNKTVVVSTALAEAFTAGDHLVVVGTSGALLHIPSADQTLVESAMGRAHSAFAALANIADESISAFYDIFAGLLGDDANFSAIAAANSDDVADARHRGRSSTRLELTATMRADMIAGLHGWRDTPGLRGNVVETVEHTGWRIEQTKAGLGVIGFVFEGRPNVFADATGVLRSGNAVVFRIGSDALRTARAIVEHALRPALMAAGLPVESVELLDTPSRAAGWALFSHPLLSLAVARGSGEAVEQLGSVARQAGVPASLHGTGGAWLVASASADSDRFSATVMHSLDRKVCNTLNVCCIVRDRAAELVPVFVDALTAAAHRRGASPRLHVTTSALPFVPATFEAALIEVDALCTEWEWENDPEVSLVVVDSVAEAVVLFNRLSPRLVAALSSTDNEEHGQFYASIDAPFVGDGFTRWVDGQFALSRPELGLSNWENGRLFARSGVLSGDSVFTVRTRMFQVDPNLHR